MDQFDSAEERIVILDFGAQYGQLIARRVREAKVFCEILPHDTPAVEIAARTPRGIIFTGGPSSVYDERARHADPAIYDLNIPILGICYGMQLMAYQLGGRVQPAVHREYGKARVHKATDSPLFHGLPGDSQVWMSHGDLVETPPPAFEIIGRTTNTPVAAIGHAKRGLYGVQFHPEVIHTTHGRAILDNFLYQICGCHGTWTMRSFVTEAVGKIRQQVGKGKAVAGLSGGVDSSVAVALVSRAIGDRLTCIFVDHGLLRQGEAEEVVRTFGRERGLNLIHVNAADRFLARLEGITDPEEKRKRIGDEFVQVFEEEAGRLGEVDFLVQGTVYPDVIESGSGSAAVIKTHHNVGGLPAHMRLRLVEPLRDLFKDEVRLVGEELELPAEIVWRHPFPGPGLAIRVLGEVTPDRAEMVRRADAILIEEVRRAGLYRDLWQCFAVLTDSMTVGVMGDQRTYGYAVAIRAVTSDDAMTADWAQLPYDLLERTATRIVNEVDGVNRVTYDITSKPPGTIEWE